MDSALAFQEPQNNDDLRHRADHARRAPVWPIGQHLIMGSGTFFHGAVAHIQSSNMGDLRGGWMWLDQSRISAWDFRLI
jgi:hypothetical protein